VQFTFSSLAHRNSYFAAGGELRFSSSLSGSSGAKYVDWRDLLTAIGTIKFNNYRVTSDSGTPAPFGGSGYNSLTLDYRQLLTKSGSAVYAENLYTLEGKIVSDTVLEFSIWFDDNDAGDQRPIVGGGPAGPAVDEPVTGTLTSVVNTFRPDSSFVYNSVSYTGVDLPSPAPSTTVSL
jgi:hypothetical protein